MATARPPASSHLREEAALTRGKTLTVKCYKLGIYILLDCDIGRHLLKKIVREDSLCIIEIVVADDCISMKLSVLLKIKF